MKIEKKKTSKKCGNVPGIPGFECFPEGKLLAQKIEFDGLVGIAYERCIGYTKPKHTHDRITITFPRGSSRSFIRVFPEEKTFNLNEDVVHIMAKDHLHEQGTVSSIYDTFALFVSPNDFEAHLKKAGVDSTESGAFPARTHEFSKSPILKDLVDRYFFCRILENKPSVVEQTHLESLILTELFALGRKQIKKAIPSSRTSKNSAVEKIAPDEAALARAIEFIESHLFEKLDVNALVRASRTSQATLFRFFKRDLGLSPIEYVRNRRLDEARALLRGSQSQVGDVALLVGYEDLSSFSKAFKAHFGISPSRAER